MQKVNLLTIEWQLRVTQRVKHLSVYCLSKIITYKEIFKKTLIFPLKPGLKSSSDG